MAGKSPIGVIAGALTSERAGRMASRPGVTLHVPWYQGTRYGRIYGRPNRSRKHGSKAGRR